MIDAKFLIMAENLREPALFVGDIEDAIDLEMPPASGEEYIKRVVWVFPSQRKNVNLKRRDMFSLKLQDRGKALRGRGRCWDIESTFEDADSSGEACKSCNVK